MSTEAAGAHSFHPINRGSAALRSVHLLSSYQNNNLGWHEVPTAVEHPRETEKPPGTPSGRRLRLEIAKSPVERLFPPSGGVSRGSVRVGGETFLLPSYGFSFGYKRKGVSIAEVTEARRKNLCAARERPCLPLRREVDACIKDLSRQTEGEIHRVCAKAVGIANSKSK